MKLKQIFQPQLMVINVVNVIILKYIINNIYTVYK